MGQIRSRSVPLEVVAGALVLILAVSAINLAAAAFCALALVVWAALRSSSKSDQVGAGTDSGYRENSREAETGTALWSQIIAALPDPVLVLNDQKFAVVANSSARALFQDIEGRHILQINRSPDLLDAVEQASETKQSKSFNLEMLTPVTRHLSGIVAPLLSGRRQPSGPALLIVLRDRTEVEQVAQMRADFVANASHELRTPLASLKGFVETLQGKAKDDAKARDAFLAIMQEQANRMSRLIDDLLSLSRIEMRQHVPPTETVELGPLIAGSLLSLRPIADQAGIALSFVKPSEPMLVVGDRDELAQVAQNLIQNAIRYGRKGGSVIVSLECVHRQISFAVADDGIGIAPHHLPRLTERFYRVSAKESRERGGTGLGLAIVKHIINRHHGELKVDSVLGRGSTFTVLLPQARES